MTNLDASRRSKSRARGSSTATTTNDRRGDRNIRWIEQNCYVPEGRLVGQRVKLTAWQKDEIRRIYDNPAGTRTAILSFGRKNGKTGLASFLLQLHLAGPEAVRNSQLYSAAQSRDQAALLFDLAQKSVRMSPTLEPFISIREATKRLACPELGTEYRALSAEASTSFGRAPAFVVFDELGQVRGPRSELYDALDTATASQESPLAVIISTQAPNDDDLLSILIDDALANNDPRTTIKLYSAPLDLDPFSVEAIKAANPAYGQFQNENEILAMRDAARRMPAREAAYRNLVLNQRVEGQAAFITKAIWDACAAEPLADWAGLDVYGGLDLSEARDLTALILIANYQGIWQVRCRFWLPEHGLAEKARDDRVPYDLWRRQGFLNATPGKTVDYSFIAAELREIFDDLSIAKIAFDRWRMRHLQRELINEGFGEDELAKFVEFGQGFKSMDPALRELETVVANGRLAHGGHPVLAMCAANAIVTRDPAGNRKLDKKRSRGRIDGMIGLAEAIGVAASEIPATEEFVTGRITLL